MPDYLTTLLTRTLSSGETTPGETLQPRPISRFEPHAAPVLPDPIPPEDTSSPPQTSSPELSPPPPPIPASLVPPPRLFPEPETPQPVAPSVQRPSIPAPNVSLRAPALPRPLSTRPAPPEIPHAGRLDTPPLPPLEPRPFPASSDDAPPPLLIREIPLERVIERARPASPTNQPINKPTNQLPPAQESPNHQTNPPSNRHSILPPPSPPHLFTSAPPLPPSPPTIHITIGRIEVRATPPPAAPARKPSSRPAVMSLDDYLKTRNGDGS